MKTTLLAITAALLGVACMPTDDTVYHVSDEATEAQYEAVLECLAEYQTMVDYELSAQRGGVVDERVSQHTRVVRVDYSKVVKLDEKRVLGRYEASESLVLVTNDDAWLAAQAARSRKDAEWLTTRVTCHEIGHSLGLSHDDCGKDSVIHPLNKHSRNLPGECEAAVLASR